MGISTRCLAVLDGYFLELKIFKIGHFNELPK